MLGRQLEVAVVGPARQDAHHLFEVRKRVELVEATRGNQAEQRGGGLGVGVAAVEHPRFAADHDLAQGALGAGVVERELGVVEHAKQLGLLVGGIAERLGRQGAAGGGRTRLADPAKEALHQRANVLLAMCRTRCMSRVLPVRPSPGSR